MADADLRLRIRGCKESSLGPSSFPRSFQIKLPLLASSLNTRFPNAQRASLPSSWTG